VAKKGAKRSGLSFGARVDGLLGEIGPYEVEAGDGGREIRWADPIPTALTPLHMAWAVSEVGSDRPPAPDFVLFALWEQFRRRQEELVRDLGRQLFDDFAEADARLAGGWRGRRPASATDLAGLGAVLSGGWLWFDQETVTDRRGVRRAEYGARVTLPASWAAHSLEFEWDRASGLFQHSG
jgi:hypothetical protein